MPMTHPKGSFVAAKDVRPGDFYPVYVGHDVPPKIRKIRAVEVGPDPYWGPESIILVFDDNGQRYARAPTARVEVIRDWS